MQSASGSMRPMRASLYELGLCSDDPDALAAYYGNAFGYAFSCSGEALLGVGRDRRLTLWPGPSKTLAYAGYGVADSGELELLRRRLENGGVPYERMDLEGFEPGALRFADPDGNRFVFGVVRSAHEEYDDEVATRSARIQHVVFATTDIARLLVFFTDTLGFVLSDRVLDAEGGLRTFFVRCSEDHHSLAVFAANENRLDHHCYEAGDWGLIRDWADHFAKQRIPLKWGPGRHGPGNNLFLFIHDPDGNWVEISAELEQVKDARPVGDWPHEEYTLNSWGIGMLRS